MAKFERTIKGDFFDILRKIDWTVLNGSFSATLEASSDFSSGAAKCSVRVYERYSAIGSNRVSLSITLFQNGEDDIHLSAIAAGGSQAVFFKINTWGEDAFLNEIKRLFD